ncbi:MAG: YbaK/EbsC family protein [Spirochaetaceae bacterium]|jgi:prolyl-tRNA editing enzyme YbaK/EbsC (Cys-tRNA(Pro) deacylase)|nr:YbaK/EbsC family protein [Spirochaetaceae bacterium]
MSIETVREHLRRWSREGGIIELAASTATVAEAAAALGVEDRRIAKSISLKCPGPSSGLENAAKESGALQTGGGIRVFVVVTAGDMKLDNRKFKDYFGFKAKMLDPKETLEYTGHAVGGVCPFGLPPGVDVYLDVSLQRFTTVYPACGNANSAVELTMEELAAYTPHKGWVDLCKPKEAQ